MALTLKWTPDSETAAETDKLVTSQEMALIATRPAGCRLLLARQGTGTLVIGKN